MTKNNDGKSVFEILAEDYPLIFLDPDKDTKETYRGVVLSGKEPERKSLAHYRGSEKDLLEEADTPAGSVRILTLGERRDYELIVRGFMAAKAGPEAKIPRSQGASELTVINWKRINAHLAAFPEEQRSEEFSRFTSKKENYLDALIVLSIGPYSNIPADKAGYSVDEWLKASQTIRRYHECTHFICRKLYPQNIDAVWDELAADAVGIRAAKGWYDTSLAEVFLGIKDGKYIGGRLENYAPEEVEDPAAWAEGMVPKILEVMAWMKEISDSCPGEPYDLALKLEENKDKTP
ncbi:MAG: hypothetical protein II966_06210 [Lachnospiraceae bacterium]|nr:hypothetical protein [Lachnospiraceae bacterium]